MYKKFRIPLWKKAPFSRLLLPLVAGILLQYYFKILLSPIIAVSFLASFVYVCVATLPIHKRFMLQALQGLVINLLLACLGSVVTWQKDIRNNNEWYGKDYRTGDQVVIRIEEPLIEKSRSYKASGSVQRIIRSDTIINCVGNILIYFAKDSSGSSNSKSAGKLKYGDEIFTAKRFEPIKNGVNPGAFNYERYAAMQQIFHTVFLKEKDLILLPKGSKSAFRQFVFTGRSKIISALQKHVSNNKDALGIAEALLIGYTNDLDRDLVQAYSNTGVVHIIAISGMHLALIYLLLANLFSRIPVLNRSRLLKTVLILACLWFFSLLTGASPSVLRAAVMFSFICFGKEFKRQGSIYNSMSVSAFVLLCFNPYFLWDAGFQLSYLAVISIVIFQKPIYNSWYLESKWADKLWELIAISVAAQILTFPACIYYFHQFPNFFLLTNIIAVPLSGIILYCELILLTLSWVDLAGALAGKLVSCLVWLMNTVVLYVNQLPFAVWDNIRASVISTWLLYIVVAGYSSWLINRNRAMFISALTCLLFFVMLHAFWTWESKNRQKLVVYDIPQHQAIDFIDGDDFVFKGDSSLSAAGTSQTFSLRSFRAGLQLKTRKPVLKSLFEQKPFYQFNDTRILIVEKPLAYKTYHEKVDIGIIIISGNPAVHIADLVSVFNCTLYVFDASNNLWKIGKWQKECEELHLRSYSLPENGAFVKNYE